MKKNIKRKIAILLLATIIWSFIYPSLNVFAHNIPKRNFSNSLEQIKDDIPNLYSKLKELKEKYPNWNFQIFNTGWDWNQFINFQFENESRSLIESFNFTRRGKAWVDPNFADKSYDTNTENGRWKKASRSAIEYFVDPRTYLNEEDIFALLNTDPKYKVKRSIEDQKVAVRTLLKGTKFENEVDIVVKVTMEENASVTEIAALLKQENGPMVNPLNVGMSGNGTGNVIESGLRYAKEHGWTDFEKGLRGGVRLVSKGYGNSGQTTKHSRKFNYVTDCPSMQYMQNIEAPMHEGNMERSSAISIDPELKKYEYTFLIPIFYNMPKEASKTPDLIGAGSFAELKPGESLVKINASIGIKYRSEPKIGYNLVGVLPKGRVIILEEKIGNENGYIWYKFRDLNGQRYYLPIGPQDQTEIWIDVLETKSKNVEEKPNKKPEEEIKPEETQKPEVKFSERKYNRKVKAIVNVDKGSNLRMRTLPNAKDGVILSELPRGKEIYIISKVKLDKDDGLLWFKAEVNGKTGYLSIGSTEADAYFKFLDNDYMFEDEYQRLLEEKKAEEERKKKEREEALKKEQEEKAKLEAEKKKKEEEEIKKAEEEKAKAEELAKQAKNVEIKKGVFKKPVEIEVVTPYGLYLRKEANLKSGIDRALVKGNKIKVSESLGIIESESNKKYLWFKIYGEELYISKGELGDSEYFKFNEKYEFNEEKPKDNTEIEKPENPEEKPNIPEKPEVSEEKPKEKDEPRDILGNNKKIFKNEYNGLKYINVIYNISKDDIKKLGEFNIINASRQKIADQNTFDIKDFATGNILEIKDEKMIIVRKGDINGDGLVDMTDALEIMNIRFGKKVSTMEKAAARLSMEETYNETISSPINIQNTRNFKILLKEILNK